MNNVPGQLLPNANGKKPNGKTGSSGRGAAPLAELAHPPGEVFLVKIGRDSRALLNNLAILVEMGLLTGFDIAGMRRLGLRGVQGGPATLELQLNLIRAGAQGMPGLSSATQLSNREFADFARLKEDRLAYMAARFVDDFLNEKAPGKDKRQTFVISPGVSGNELKQPPRIPRYVFGELDTPTFEVAPANANVAGADETRYATSEALAV